MPLSIPSYLQAAGIEDNIIHFRWDDWNVEQAEEPIDDVVYGRVERISQRADAAITIGIAEWIVYRFRTLSNDPLPLFYLEAAWAQLIDLRYGAVQWDAYSAKGEWTGPIKCPISTAMDRVTDALLEAHEAGQPELMAAWITNLGKYVMNNPVPYRTWWERIMERMERLYSRNSEDELGDVIPREVLNPDLDFAISETESLINRFLAGLDYRTNVFLNSPEEMLKNGFKGTPYRFNFAIDREKRFDW